MSGHNPHGRLGQPNSSWNHLQVPSFIPRQPQLAHVHMNDTMLRSSPLNWHGQSDSALYSYAIAAAAATHKTTLDLNPLLPAFVRPPVANSFGSVDLSFPSHARHNLTPSPHNINNVSTPNSVTPPLEFSSTSQFSIKSTLNSSAPAIQTPTSLKDVTSNIVNGDKLSNNGNEKLGNGESMVPSNLATGLFVAHQLNNETAKNNPWILPPTHPELIKETVKIFKNVLINEFIERNPPIDQTSSLNHSAVPNPLTDLSNITTNNNTSVPQSEEYASPTHGNTSNSQNTSRDSVATTSNEDSLDYNACKKRRRRKPNKTCRLSNNDIDEEVLSNNNKHTETITANQYIDQVDTTNQYPDQPPRLTENQSSVSRENSEQNIEIKTNLNEINRMDSASSGNKIIEPQLSVNSQSNVENGVLGGDASNIINTPLEYFNSPPMTRNRRSNSRLRSPNELSQENSSNSSSASIQRRPGKRKLETDDCETIDKIAAMIASCSPEFNPGGDGCSTPIRENPTPTENGNLKDILDTNDDHVEQKDNRFEDVEIKLEEMFAGIDDDPNQTVKQNLDSSCKEVRVAIKNLGSMEKIATKSKKKKTAKSKANKKNLNSSSSTDEMDHKGKKMVKRLPKSKTKNGAGKKNNKTNKICTNVTDNKKTKIKEETSSETTSKFKGPFIHVKSDGSSNVVNAPITEEVAEHKSKVKKTFINQSQNDRTKIRGLHVSTLSMKYDAATTDKTWICVFCKIGPHKFGLGDLFGPYILSTTCEDFALSQIDPSEDVFKTKRTKANMIQKRTLPVTSGAVGTPVNKRKRKTTEPIPSTSSHSSNNSLPNWNNDVIDIFYGMTKATDESYEVWVHGDCAVWSSGVHLIGTRIVGLEAAVWGSSRHKCSKCQNYGAMLCCFKRGCGDVAHIPCARAADWNLCSDSFKVLCDKHCDKVEIILSGTSKST